MTINSNSVVLWDDGITKLRAVAVPLGNQYRYTDGKPCITIGFEYEDFRFKGYDSFTFFDQYYVDLLNTIKATHRTLNGSFRLYDMGADTDGFIDFHCKNGKLEINGQLGATFSDFSLRFHFDADQTLISSLLSCMKI